MQAEVLSDMRGTGIIYTNWLLLYSDHNTLTISDAASVSSTPLAVNSHGRGKAKCAGSFAKANEV